MEKTGNIEAADERITHQIARRIEQEEKKRKSADSIDQHQEDVMQDDMVEKMRTGICPRRK